MLASGQALSARYVLIRPLGAGGGGAVWLAQDRERGAQVALKILTGELTRNAAALAALQRECEQAARLVHPYIVRVDGLYRSSEHAWIAMEYAPGGDLSQLRCRGWAQVLQAVIPVASALAYAHRAGMVHRDVKPTNVLFAADGTPRLADFGHALALSEIPAADAGRGSPYSMSPQQRDGKAASTADDIYGYGAMLYELLCGYPPFYPDAAAAASGSLPAPLPAFVPPQLARAVERMLAHAPEQRPASMELVERELLELSGSLSTVAMNHAVSEPTPRDQALPREQPSPRVEPPSIRPPTAQAAEPLRSEWRRARDTGASADELRRQGFRRGLGAAAIILGLAAVAFVFLALPRWVGPATSGESGAVAQAGGSQQAPAAPDAQQRATPAKAAPGANGQAGERTSEIDFAALALAKQQAEEQRAAIDDRLQKLTARAAERWGAQNWTRANEELRAADAAIAAREYPDAVEHYEAMQPLLTALERRAGEVLADQLAKGAAALASGRSKEAHDAFELAARIDPKNPNAALGLKRAGSLDEVLKLLADAGQREQDGDASGALELYRKALALDAQAPRAAEGIARIETRLANDAFASAMARGYGALASADYGVARSAFEAAHKIRPDAPEIAQALRQIEQEQRTGVISAKLDSARQLEENERWAEALREYRAILELDSTIAAASEGVARVSPRAALDEQLELYLTQPERLFSQPVRAAAREALVQAGRIADPGPTLRRQMATLTDWLQRADVPVQVALQSDNLTHVTIYRVGELGAFAQRSLELRPGSYTVVGTRPGYRDVRREIMVKPGAELEPVVIRCEDRI